MSILKSLLVIVPLLGAGVAPSPAATVPLPTYSVSCSGIAVQGYNCAYAENSSAWNATVSGTQGGTVTANSTWNPGSPSGTASAVLTYHFAVDPVDPSNTTYGDVGILIFGSLSATTTGSSNSYAYARIIASLNDGTSITRDICSYGCGAGEGVASLNPLLRFTMSSAVSSGSIYLQAVASAFGGNGSTAQAKADPYIYIDPEFPDAENFRIVVSEGIDNVPAVVPLPAAWLLMVAGAGILGALRRQRGHVMECID
ncbi:MAG: hypothetical protein H6978_08620 [Gammaproteobacteria bacterium]|nr:hypothetical protein [Gammaproteobacteria bacterium]